MQPPTQELVVRDLHDNTWTFRHIYRGEHAEIGLCQILSLLFCFVLMVVCLFMIHLAVSLMFIPPVLSYCVGQPKRHLLTTGWSMFVGAKRLRAGDSVLFIRYCKNKVMKVAAARIIQY